MASAEIPSRSLRFHTVSGWETEDIHLPAEAGILLSVNGEAWLSFHCTPADLDALAAGFLFCEGIISQKEEIAAITICGEGTHIDVWLHHSAPRPTAWQRTSGCMGGMTSVTTQAEQGPARISTFTQIEPEALLMGMEQFTRRQDLYHRAGGVHGSAIGDGKTVSVLVEDIGRHNTLDKLAGRLLLDDIHLYPKILYTTGRISMDMLQKAARMGVEVVVSRNSATSKAAAMAEQLGITVAGYTRANSFRVYSCPSRFAGAG
jgi:FdhD protein